MPPGPDDIGNFDVVPGIGQAGDMAFHGVNNRLFRDPRGGEEDSPEPEPDTEPGPALEDEEDEEEGEEEAGTEETGEEEGEEEDAEPGQPAGLEDEHLDKMVPVKGGDQVSVRELISGFMRNKDYTQGKQQQAEERRQVEGMVSDLEGWKQRNQRLESLDRHFQANPWLLQAADRLWAGDYEGAQAIAAQSQRIMPQEPAPGPPQQQQQPDLGLQVALFNRWTYELDKIKADYPGVDEKMLWDALPNHLDAMGQPSMTETFKALYFDKAREASKEQGRKQAIRSMKKGAKEPTSMKPGQATASGQKKYRGTPAERAFKQFRDME